MTDDARLNQELRKRTLTATDIVVLRGHYGSELELWAKKVKGIRIPLTQEKEDRFWWGTHMEPVIWRFYCRQMGLEPELGWAPNTIPHPSIKILSATPDYVVPVGGGLWRLVEIKTWSTRRTTPAPPWIDQVHWQWGIVNAHLISKAQGRLADEIHVVCCQMAHGPEGAIYRIQFDAEHWHELLKLGVGWWTRHIINGERPEPSSRKVDADVLGLLHPAGDSGRYKVAEDQFGRLYERDKELGDEIGVLMAERNALRNRVRAAIGSADGLVRPGGDRDILWTWKTTLNGTRQLRRR